MEKSYPNVPNLDNLKKQTIAFIKAKRLEQQKEKEEEASMFFDLDMPHSKLIKRD